MQCYRSFDHQSSPCKLDRFYQVSKAYDQVDPKTHSTMIPCFHLTLAFFYLCCFPAVLFECYSQMESRSKMWHQLTVFGSFCSFSNKSHAIGSLNESFWSSCLCRWFLGFYACHAAFICFQYSFFAGIVFLNTPYFWHDQLLFAVSITHAPHEF